MSTHVQWLTPAPLWQELSGAGDLTPFRRPAILRFATDDFMPELQGVLQQTPQSLRDYVAQGENWQNPAAGLASGATGLPLKLYQPVHARFYLVATSLTCRIPGLPDHTVNRTQGESLAFVVRQLRPNPGYSASDCAVYSPATCTEYAWVPGQQPGWQQAPGIDLLPGEERIPLAPTQTGSNGTSRRILTGLIPASRRQQYVTGRTLKNGSGNGTGTATDPRADMFNRQVATPWANLEAWWDTLDAPSQATQKYIDSARLSSALILLDFANWLLGNISNVWAAIVDSSKVAGLSNAEAALYNTLSPTLEMALFRAKQFESQFESAGPSDPFPPNGYTPYSLADPANAIDPTTLLAPVTAALPPLAAPSLLPPVPQKPSNPQGDYYFIVRCIYLRPKCGYNVVSPPSQPFQLASYFDSDAPARHIQVALPVDTSPEALRKFDKGVAFLISDELQKQMSRVKSLQALSQGDIGDPDPGIGLGMICSFSIPIITICAMILLFVIVIALNLVFFWIPFFKICLPVPTLKGK